MGKAPLPQKALGGRQHTRGTHRGNEATSHQEGRMEVPGWPPH